MNNFIITPIKTYKNPYENKYIIYKENKGKSGIYRWVDLVNNKSYIGSSISLDNRLSQYFSLIGLKRKSEKTSSLIYKSIVKYGFPNFQLEILEYTNIETLIAREQYYIDLLKPEYNICKIAKSRLGYKHTEETKLKISNKIKGENNPFYGKEHSYETRNRISESLKDYFTKLPTKKCLEKRSTETKLKLSIRCQGVKIQILDKNNKLISSFPTITSGANFLQISNRTLSRRLNKGYCNNYLYLFEDTDK